MRKSIFLSVLIAVILCFTSVLLLSCGDDDHNKPNITKYTVTFDSNGGSPVNSQSILNGGKVAEPTEKPNKNGYTFVGWFDGDLAWDFSNNVVASNVTLKAKWTLNTYTITYIHLKGATNTNPTTYTIESESINLASISNNEADFIGWFDQDGNKITNIPKGTYANIFLTARWSSKHTVSFDTNGAGNVSNQLVSDGLTLVKPQTIAKEHYTFDGWYTNDGKKWNFDTDLVTEELKLFAKWIPVEYEAVFVAMGERVKTIKFTIEDEALSQIPLVPQKNGYENGTWENYTLKLGGFTVNAVYTPITYTITYVNKFDTTHNNRTTFTVETETFILSKPNGKTGYICSGWTNGDDFVTLVEKGTCENLTLEAVWTPIQYYAEFYVDDKYSCTVEFTVEDSVLPYSPPVPAKEGYKGEWSAYTLDAENIRIDAVYTLETYTIIYGNLNGRENTNVTSYNKRI